MNVARRTFPDVSENEFAAVHARVDQLITDFALVTGALNAGQTAVASALRNKAGFRKASDDLVRANGALIDAQANAQQIRYLLGRVSKAAREASELDLSNRAALLASAAAEIEIMERDLEDHFTRVNDAVLALKAAQGREIIFTTSIESLEQAFSTRTTVTSQAPPIKVAVDALVVQAVTE